MIRRILGILLTLLGVLGIALAALGVVTVWRSAAAVSIAADDSLRIASETVDDIDTALHLASSTLDEAGVAISGLYDTTLDVSRTLSSTRTTVDEMAGLAEDDLPRSIEASLMALDGLEESAAVIDRLLRSLQEFGIGQYNPAVPLDEAVAQAQSGLTVVPSSLRTMGDGLRETSAGLDDVQQGILEMGNHVLGLRENVDDADVAVDDFRTTLRELRSRLQSLQQNVDRPIRTVAWGATLLLIWVAVTQLAIIRWGVSLWTQVASQTEGA